MAAINGTLILLQDNGTAFALVQDATLNINADLPDASTKDSAGWAEHIKGQKSWDVEVNGLASWGSNNAENVQLFAEYLINRSDIDVEFEPDVSSDDVTGDQVSFQGTASMASVSISAPNEDVSTISGTLTGTGALTRTTVS